MVVYQLAADSAVHSQVAVNLRIVPLDHVMGIGMRWESGLGVKTHSTTSV